MLSWVQVWPGCFPLLPDKPLSHLFQPTRWTVINLLDSMKFLESAWLMRVDSEFNMINWYPASCNTFLTSIVKSVSSFWLKEEVQIHGLRIEKPVTTPCDISTNCFSLRNSRRGFLFHETWDIKTVAEWSVKFLRQPCRGFHLMFPATARVDHQTNGTVPTHSCSYIKKNHTT